ncbi:hypothetical protein RND81_10G212000 [Saponaria officinalis]|uniref:FCP1 homology domain-containing protein n=1 Tax=Saponaria officinalis TaxID=3572 RepID=A0AAW1I779_SAPOF
MEQTVAERPFSQGYHATQIHAWRNGPEGSRSSHSLQDPSQSRDPRRWTGRDRSNMFSGRFNGEDTREDKSRAPVCRDNLRGQCTRGSFCKYAHQLSGFVNHDGATFYRNDQRNLGLVVDPNNSQLFSENQVGDSRRPLNMESRSRSPSRRYQSGHYHQGSTGTNLHPEFTKYSETDVGDSSGRSFFVEGRRRSPCRKFQSGRCDRGSTCRYLHSEFAVSDRPIHDWNAEQHHGGAASRNPRFHEENLDNNLRTSQVHDGAIKENNSRFSISGEFQNRSPCRNFLQGRCHRGASCRRWHPHNAYKNSWSAEQQPMVTGNSNDLGFADGRSALPSREHIEANRQNNFRPASFSGDPRGRPSCQYSHRGSCYQGAPSANLHSAAVYHRTRFDFGGQHHQGVTSNSRDPSFDRGNVVREVNSNGVRSNEGTHAGYNGSLNDRGVHTHHTRENITGATRSWSLERKRNRPDFVGNQLQPEVCLRFTKGKCDQGANCRYLHSFHEYASSISQQSQKPHLEAAADLMNIGQANQCAETMGVHVHDTSKDEDVNLWSQPFKRHRTSNGFSFGQEDGARYRTALRQDYSMRTYNRSRYHHESQNQYPDSRSFMRDGPANRMNNEQQLEVSASFVTPSVHGDTNSFLTAPDQRGEVLSHGMRLNECSSGNPCLEAANLTKKNDVESAENALRCNHTGRQAMESVTDCKTVKISGGETAINHEPLKSALASSFQKHSISEAKAAVVLGKSETAGVKADLAQELNEKTEGTENISRSVPEEQAPATVRNGMLVGDTNNTLLPASQLSDAAILKCRRKLLVLDVNGLLADIVADFPDRYKPDAIVAGKGVFKRPFCDDFLQFCFEKFDVGIWSSRTEKNVTRVLDCLMEKTKNKLLFCWHQSHCTQTGYRTVENSDKPLLLKELNKLWEKEDENLPWKKGFYNETNTILLDDSPYKALRNPPHTAIFPFPYSFRHAEDTSLGPNGELRLYLERLAEAENVQKFIEENPFGQRPITKTNLSWAFYSKIAGEHTSQQKTIASINPES